MAEAEVRVVFPHQLFAEHLSAPRGTRFVLVEHDLHFRQYAFHAHKLVLHRASMRAFADRLREASYDVEVVESRGNRRSSTGLARALEDHHGPVVVHDLVDDWLEQDLRSVADEVEVRDSPNFLTSEAELRTWFGGHPGRGSDGQPRMQHFYAWQRRRLDILMEAGEPTGGHWSYDPENRKKLPRGHPVPEVAWPSRGEYVEEAVDWVAEHFPDAPGDPSTFCWPVTHEEARASYEDFLEHRLHEFGPYEDAMAREHPVLFHAILTPALNIGLLDPREVVDGALARAQEGDVPLASLEGFVRQVIGWREYMRASYVLHGRRLRTSNTLEHTRRLGREWWTASTGLDPVDHVIGKVLETGWAHHIERLMVIGNAMCLLRIHPDEVYRWFSELFVDAYDWVMVPNVYAMSQFAAGSALTTKPYVSGSNYLRKMSDHGPGEWRDHWDALYWTFVADHRELLADNPRTQMMTRMWDRLDASTKQSHRARARPWLT